MPDCVESVPGSWTHRFFVPLVPKDGSPFEETFDLRIEKPLRYWGQVYTFKSPVAASVRAERADGRIVLTISVRTDAEIPCSRCLEPAGVAIIGELRYLYSLHAREDIEAQREKTNAEQDGEEDVILLSSWEDEIDLGPLVWEVLVTSLPPTALCSDYCKGLCPQCGVNLNKSACGCKPAAGDPRFEVLKDLTLDDEKECTK